MAASVRLLARFYINAPKSQTSAGLLVGRCGYTKDGAASPADDGKKVESSTQRDDDAAIADALKSAVQKVSSWSSDPEEAHTMMKELERRVASLAGPGDRHASSSITQRILTEAARSASSRGDLTSEAAAAGYVRRQRAAPDAADVPAVAVEGVPVVSRQRVIATHKAAAAASSSSSRRTVQGSGEQAMRQRLMQEQRQPSMVPDSVSVAEQLVRERRAAATDRRRQPRGLQVDADHHAAATPATAPAVDVSGPRQSQAAASSASRSVLASLRDERAPPATAASESKSGRDILAAASTGGVSERLPSQGQSLTAQMMQGRSTARRVQGTYRATSESVGRQQGGPAPAASVDVNLEDVAKRFRDALDKTVHDTAAAQAEETKKSLSILDQLMGPRTDKFQPRNSSFGGSWNSYKLYEGKRLNLFHPEKWSRDTQETKWNSLWATHIYDAASFAAHLPPSNAFEEQIQLTKEGKLWTFPIDNEAGLENEKTVPFTEHVFLEKHLTNFPKKGPVRHFMELVVNGLSKNPYITVDEKVGHIKWFEKYFADKKGLLEELGTEQQPLNKDAAV